MKFRHVQMSAHATLHQRQVAQSEPCDVPGCHRPRAIKEKLDGGIILMRRWCEKHRLVRNRPLAQRMKPRDTPIPERIRQFTCRIPECENRAQVERTARVVDGVTVAGWNVRAYCNAHRSPHQRPIGWLPVGTGTSHSFRHHLKKFLGITRWMDRGQLMADGYRIRVGRLLWWVPVAALDEIRTEQEKPWKDRETLGAFAARYNLAVTAVVGATYALMEMDGHGKG